MPILLPPTKENGKEGILPLVPLRNLVAFPGVDLQLVFGRQKSIDALVTSFESDKLIMVSAQEDPRVDDPEDKDLYRSGVICRVEHIVRIDGTIHAVFKGLRRAKITEFLGDAPYIRVKFKTLTEIVEETEEVKVLTDHLLRIVKKAFSLGKIMDPAILVNFSKGVPASELADQVAFSLDLPVERKQKILETVSLRERLEVVSESLFHEINILRLDQSIEKKTKAKFERQMKKAVLEERKKAINRELKRMGVSEGESDDLKELRKKIKAAKMPFEVRKKAVSELNRLVKMSPFSPEVSYIRTYLEWLAEMPWSKTSQAKLDIKKSKKILDQDHFGLKEAKERILEHLAVMKLRKKASAGKKAPKNGGSGSNLLCFIGPPGVGKTSIGRSVSRALGRKFARVSLGGIRDEAEIRGHRRTYVGALPGRIIQGIKNAGTKDPVFMLDEIDKLGSDFRGDPSSALLEVLDSEQNREFSDHYLEVPFDLSQVFFILTGNVTSTIPGPLLDRLEIIHFSGYTDEEKLAIAKKYLVPKQVQKHGLRKKDVDFSDPILREIIRGYTREAGVRELERVIARVCRKVARKIAEGKVNDSKISKPLLRRFLGPRKFSHQLKGKKDEAGVSTGLAWTQAGGEILFIEVALMPGRGRMSLTGKLGTVMKESCHAALSYVRSHWRQLGIKDKDFFQKTDFHIHVPEGAVSKDGPSAGVAITTALVSALTKTPVFKDVGMTGEVTLRGQVLPIGGVKEKVLAAHRAGIKKVVLPKENKKDLYDLPKKVKKDIEFVFADKISQVLKEALKV